MARTGADSRLARLLAMVPWVAAQDGPTVEEVCARFDLNERELAGELELLYMCGLHPYSPDMLIEADIEDGRVWIRFADFFARPLRLTAAEGLSLLAAGAALLGVPGADAEGPLARGLAKLAAALGIDADDAIDVDLATAAPDLLQAFQQAVAHRRVVEIDYYAFGRDERTTRTIEPWSVFGSGGEWYVAAWCRMAEAERLFRLDRVERAVPLEAVFDPRPVRPSSAVYHPRQEDPVVVMDLTPDAAWVAEQFHMEEVIHRDDGALRVRFRASEQVWLERLLLQLGPNASVVEGAAGVLHTAAARVLARYGP